MLFEERFWEEENWVGGGGGVEASCGGAKCSDGVLLEVVRGGEDVVLPFQFMVCFPDILDNR